MSTAPLLSICIPTFNRAGYLRDALESIAVQLRDDPTLKREVEVVVADNASTDNTEGTARSFAGAFDHFRYIKNPTNVGFDGNVNIAVRAASGVYGWYLGDDDIIIGGAIVHILKLCRGQDYALITVPDRPLVSREAALRGQETYAENDHITDLSPHEFYHRGYLASALSMLIFRRDEWLSAANFADHTPGWFYYEPIMKLAAKTNRRLLRITKPMVWTGQDMRWADGGAGLKIFIDCNRFLGKMADWGYDKEAAARELAGNVRKFPRVLLQAKARGLPQTRQNWLLVKTFTATSPQYVMVISRLLFWVPNPVIKLLRRVKKSLV